MGIGVPEKVAWVLVRDGQVLVTRTHGRELFYFPGGHREPGESDAETLVREIDEKAWFRSAQRDRVSLADQLVFDTLHADGRLP
ncbi:NUDIX domain-containing protein [Kribbella sp. NBC_01245]|uniref:NUDIX domain-containing protein n=1 Tax=Kribbella sp. NBC_01245 TaxID=2903578 RepID=UPI002E281E3D|nr:NUDIX domain-containing protein [Kribbella sp. NBC_01245]